MTIILFILSGLYFAGSFLLGSDPVTKTELTMRFVFRFGAVLLFVTTVLHLLSTSRVLG